MLLFNARSGEDLSGNLQGVRGSRWPKFQQFPYFAFQFFVSISVHLAPLLSREGGGNMEELDDQDKRQSSSFTAGK